MNPPPVHIRQKSLSSLAAGRNHSQGLLSTPRTPQAGVSRLAQPSFQVPPGGRGIASTVISLPPPLDQTATRPQFSVRSGGALASRDLQSRGG